MKSWGGALLLVVAALVQVGCGGEDEPDGTGGDGGGDASGGTASGGTSTGGATSGGTGGTGGSGGSGGSGTGGELSFGSGKVTADVDGVTVEFDAYQVAYAGGSFNELSISADTTPGLAADGIGIDFVGTEPGSADCTTWEQGGLSLQAPREDGDTGSFQSQGQSSCTITITEYGAVGQPIRGTFSGIVYGSGESKTITNGSFDVIRGSDF